MTKKLKLLDTKKRSQNIKTPWFVAAKSKLKEENMKRYEVTRNKLCQQINNIRLKTSKIWEENQHKTHSEHLEPNDIIIDVEAYDGKLKEIESRSTHLQDKITDKAKKDLCRVNWLKKECVDKMEVPFCQLFGINENSQYSVTNIPIKKMSKSYEKQLLYIRTLRLNEIIDMQRDKNKSSACGCSWSSYYNDRNYKKIALFSPTGTSYLPPSYLNAIQKENILDRWNTVVENESYFVDIDENCPVIFLLYPPFSMRSNNQRRFQIKLLQLLVREVALKFNQTFEILKEEKLATVRRIKNANKKVASIMEELGLNEQLMKTVVKDEENIGVLITKLEDITNRENNKNSPILEKRQIHKKQSDCVLNKNHTDSYQRALMDMMNGTLVVKLVSKLN